MNTLISLTAQYLYLVCGAAAVLFWLRLDRTKQRQLIIWGLISGAIAVILTKVSGALISDPRPFVVGHYAPLFTHAADNGFPSDHTVLTSLLGFLILPYSKRFGIFLLVLAVLVGSARVAAGIHHPIDIVAGFVISAIAVAAGFALLRLKETRFQA